MSLAYNSSSQLPKDSWACFYLKDDWLSSENTLTAIEEFIAAFTGNCIFVAK